MRVKKAHATIAPMAVNLKKWELILWHMVDLAGKELQVLQR